jgi:hypothetical protein
MLSVDHIQLISAIFVRRCGVALSFPASVIWLSTSAQRSKAFRTRRGAVHKVHTTNISTYCTEQLLHFLDSSIALTLLASAGAQFQHTQAQHVAHGMTLRYMIRKA